MDRRWRSDDVITKWLHVEGGSFQGKGSTSLSAFNHSDEIANSNGAVRGGGGDGVGEVGGSNRTRNLLFSGAETGRIQSIRLLEISIKGPSG